MSRAVQLSDDSRTIIVRVPLRLRKRGGRKLMVTSAAPHIKQPKGKPSDTILKALGRAYRWKRLLETCVYASIGDLAAAEKINHSYIRRLLRLTLLSPEITEMLLGNRQPGNPQLEKLVRPLPLEWGLQASQFRKMSRR